MWRTAGRAVFYASVSGCDRALEQVGLDGSLRRLDRNNFAPRLGLAWRPTGGSFVVRLGYGFSMA